MATRMNRFSPALRGTPVVAREDGEERDTDQSAAAAQSDPAPAELDDYRKRLIAYEAGKQAKAAGGVDWDDVCFENEQIALAWEAGWRGLPLPEGEDE